MGNTSSAHGFMTLNLVLIDCANFESIRSLHHCFIRQLKCPSVAEIQTWTQLSLLLAIEAVNQRTLNEYANCYSVLKCTNSYRTVKVSAIPNREFGRFDCTVVHTCSPTHGFVQIRINLCIIMCLR